MQNAALRIIVARGVGKRDGCGIVARIDGSLFAIEGDFKGHVAVIQRRGRPRPSHISRLIRAVIGHIHIGLDFPIAFQYHLRDGELINIYCAVKDIVCVIGRCGSGISARVDRLSFLGDLIARHGDGGGHAVAVKHADADGSEDGVGGDAVVCEIVNAAPSACGKGEPVYIVSKGVVLIAYGVSALAFYRNGISTRGKSVRAEYSRHAFRIGYGNGEVVRRKRAALRSAFNGEVSGGYKFFRILNGTAVSCGLLRFHGFDRHGSGGNRLFNGCGVESYIIVVLCRALPEVHRRGERYFFTRGKGMTRFKAACRDHYGILLRGSYAGRGKFGHIGGKTEIGNLRSV